MQQSGLKIYGYQWIILLAFMFVIAVNQLLWITFAPITGVAASYQGLRRALPQASNLGKIGTPGRQWCFACGRGHDELNSHH